MRGDGEERERRKKRSLPSRKKKKKQFQHHTLASTSSASLVFSAAGTSWRRILSHELVMSCVVMRDKEGGIASEKETTCGG